MKGCRIDEGEPAEFEFFSGTGVGVGVHAGGLIHGGVCAFLGLGYWLLSWASATAKMMMARVSAIRIGVVII